MKGKSQSLDPHLDFDGASAADVFLFLRLGGESIILLRSVALVLLRTVNSVDLAAASRVLDKSVVKRLLGSVMDTVGVSFSSNFPKSGVEVHDEDKDLFVLNL